MTVLGTHPLLTYDICDKNPIRWCFWDIENDEFVVEYLASEVVTFVVDSFLSCKGECKKQTVELT